MQFFGLELLAVCHHYDKFDDRKYCGSGDMTFLICHVTSNDYSFKGSCEIIGGRFPR